MPEETVEPSRPATWHGGFSLTPLSEREVLLEMSRDITAIKSEVALIKAQTQITNGRISKVERFMWSMLGGLVVTLAIVVPLFVNMVQGGK